MDKAEFLGKLDIFSDLYKEELEELAQITDEYEFEAGAAIAYQRDIADRFYIVRSGRLFARRVDERGIVRESRSYMTGDYFNDVWLFTPRTHDMTVNAATSGRMLVIEEKNFLDFLIRNPEILDALQLSDEARYEAEHSQAALPGGEARKFNLLTDEIVEFYERRTGWLLFIKIIGPLLLLIGAGYLAIDFWVLGQSFLTILAAVVSVILLVFSILIYIDWANDYFVITNKHLLHTEFKLFRFQTRDHKVPIDQVQSVEILRPNLLQTILNVGNAKITTASREGVLLFDYISDPREVEETINKLRQRVKALDAGREQAVMRASIEEHFQAPAPFKKVEDPDEVTRAGLKPRMSLFQRIRRGVAARLEEGNVITYRKHVFTLLTRTWWQLLLGLLSLIFAIVATSIYLAGFVVIVGIINLLVFVWRFEDWRNDTFQVTDRYVIDIDRAPFGFGESRKQAQLDNVQNISAERPGLLQTIFNFGNVEIETAGATANITFENVVNPSRVQSDVFQRREQFAQAQRVREGQQRRKELAVFLDAYQQAEEQNRLPLRRTPPLEDLETLDDSESLGDYEP